MNLLNKSNHLAVAALIAFLPLALSADELTVHVETPGTLSSLIPADKKFTITKLTLTGTVNGYDWQVIREMSGVDFNWKPTAGSLENLDISGITIVGGDPVVTALGSDPSDPIIIPARDNALSEELFTSTKIKQIVMPANITAIYSAFSGAALEGTVTVPEGVEILGEYAFEGCGKMERIILPSTLKNLGDPLRSVNLAAIGSNAFQNCVSLKEFTIPAAVTVIRSGTFSGCTFKHFVIPANIEYIDYGAFGSCNSLTDMTVANPVPCKLVFNAFQNVALENVTLHVPAGSSDAYKNAEEWCCFGNITETPYSGPSDAITAAAVDYDDRPAEYFTLQGVKITGYPQSAGIYINRQGKTCKKVIVR